MPFLRQTITGSKVETQMAPNCTNNIIIYGAELFIPYGLGGLTNTLCNICANKKDVYRDFRCCYFCSLSRFSSARRDPPPVMGDSASQRLFQPTASSWGSAEIKFGPASQSRAGPKFFGPKCQKFWKVQEFSKAGQK